MTRPQVRILSGAPRLTRGNAIRALDQGTSGRLRSNIHPTFLDSTGPQRQRRRRQGTREQACPVIPSTDKVPYSSGCREVPPIGALGGDCVRARFEGWPRSLARWMIHRSSQTVRSICPNRPFPANPASGQSCIRARLSVSGSIGSRATHRASASHSRSKEEVTGPVGFTSCSTQRTAGAPMGTATIQTRTTGQTNSCVSDWSSPTGRPGRTTRGVAVRPWMSGSLVAEGRGPGVLTGSGCRSFLRRVSSLCMRCGRVSTWTSARQPSTQTKSSKPQATSCPYFPERLRALR